MYKIFADPFNTAGLVIDTTMHEGFVFEVVDVYGHRKINFSCPEETYDLLTQKLHFKMQFLGTLNFEQFT